MTRPATPSDYRWMYDNDSYMPDGLKTAMECLPYLEPLMPCSVLDVGGGRGDFIEWCRGRGCRGVHNEDPAFGGDRLPYLIDIHDKSFDLVTCFDVLEHIPTRDVGMSLTTLETIATRHVCLSICWDEEWRGTEGGELVNVHLTLEGPDWWDEQIRTYMDPQAVQRIPCRGNRCGFLVTV